MTCDPFDDDHDPIQIDTDDKAIYQCAKCGDWLAKED